MKKSGLFLIGILVVVLVCGLLFTGCSNPFEKLFGGDSASGGTDEDPSWRWSQGQWADWFNNHSPYEPSDMNTVNTFRAENSLWVTNNSWWTTMYTAWMTGSYIDGSGYDSGGGSDLSTSWSQSQWQNWFNTHPVTNPSNATAVSTFYSQNYSWCIQTSWWTTMYTTWSTGGGGGGGGSDLSTTWGQSQWASWFNGHPVTTYSNATAVSTFSSQNSLWISNNPWWTTMYSTWVSGGIVYF
ncbi:MAG: hypothetical protein LBK83_06275 [Treponema sp.]|jgi:hypothetical protein|nr:hypothetical protein [Treponema sp.]